MVTYKVTKRPQALAVFIVFVIASAGPSLAQPDTDGGGSLVRLEGGQEVRFSLTPSFDSLNEIDGAAVTVVYCETSRRRAASLALRRLAVQAGSFLRCWLLLF